MQWAQNKNGFTIVELLIVIVVIAILAVITVVAYNGVTNRANQSAVQNELATVSKRLATYKIQNGSEQYPATLADAGLTSLSSTMTYYPNVSTSKDYCVTGTLSNQTYYISSRMTSPQLGNCDLTSGLLGWWRFNGNANDSSSLGNNGTAVNTAAATGQNGVANNAYTFSTSYVTATVPSFDRISFTATAWFKATASADRKIISSNINSSTHLVQILAGGYLRNCIGVCVVGPRSFTDGNWHFVAVVGSATGARIYVDGEASPELTNAYGSSSGLGTQIRVGADFTPSFHFAGEIDDVRLYNRALSLEETYLLYSAGAR